MIFDVPCAIRPSITEVSISELAQTRTFPETASYQYFSILDSIGMCIPGKFQRVLREFRIATSTLLINESERSFSTHTKITSNKQTDCDPATTRVPSSQTTPRYRYPAHPNRKQVFLDQRAGPSARSLFFQVYELPPLWLPAAPSIHQLICMQLSTLLRRLFDHRTDTNRCTTYTYETLSLPGSKTSFHTKTASTDENSNFDRIH